jgi:hypothetical protein
MPTYLLIPLIFLLGLLLFFGLFAFLARFRGGRYLQAIIVFLAKIPFMRRFFVWSQRRMTEKQNPELASVMRKLERLGSNPDPRATQQVLSRFTRAEKKAYDDYLALARDSGQLPDAPNRQARRMQQRQIQGTKPPATGPKKAGKRRR